MQDKEPIHAGAWPAIHRVVAYEIQSIGLVI